MNESVSKASASVLGARFGGVAAGIKKKAGALDLALIACDAPATIAGVFTTNLVAAAPVKIAAQRVRAGKAKAVLVNAGCANACTGAPGLKAAERATRAVAEALGVRDTLVVPASTGVIGVVLPAEKIEAHAAALVGALDPDGLDTFAQAIMTTDRYPKVVRTELRLGRARARVVGVAKGAGMIHPNMATTLAFVLTDADVTPAALSRALRAATEVTFNRISVDGDTSTNDTILALATGARPGARVAGKPAEAALAKALTLVLDGLARLIASDGEGAEHLVTFDVRGLATDRDALAVARTIATSPLVKTALFGADPNWGRILAAAGRAGVAFDPERAEILVGGVPIVRRGTATGGDSEARAHAVMKTADYEVRVTLGRGKGRAFYRTCDLGHAYVTLNADYRS